MIFPQRKGRFTGQRKQGRKSALCFPSQHKFTWKRHPRHQTFSRHPSAPNAQTEEVIFLRHLAERFFCKQLGREASLGCLGLTPGGPHLFPLTTHKAAEDHLNNLGNLSLRRLPQSQVVKRAQQAPRHQD